MITADQERELRFMANCHNKAPLWSEFNRQAIADVLADVDALTVARDDARVTRDAALQEVGRVVAERDALAAELATVRAQLAAVPVDAIKGFVASTAHLDMSRGAERYADEISAWTARLVRYAVNSQA